MDKLELKQYRETVNKIRELLGYGNQCRETFGSSFELILSVFNLMEKNMNDLVEDKEVKVSDKDKENVKRVVNIFLNVAVDQPITPLFRDLSHCYLLLAFNWNKELGKMKNVENIIKAVQRITDGQLTMVDTISLMKQLQARLKSFQNYNPPVFELSRHYLETLIEENREQEKKEKEKNKDKDKDKGQNCTSYGGAAK